MRKILSVVLTIILIAIFTFSLCVSAQQLPQDNVTTSFDEKTGTLTVSGTGKVSDLFGRNLETDFLSWADNNTIKEIDTSVKHLIIKDGITEIYNSFNDMHMLEDVSLPSTLQKIDTAFIDCDALKSVKFPKSLKQICRTSFYDCDALAKIKFSSPIILANDNQVESRVFHDLDSLEYVSIPSKSTLSDVFINCANLKTVVLGKNITVLSGLSSAVGNEAGPCFINGSEDLTVYLFKADTGNNLEHIKTVVYGIWVIIAIIIVVIIIGIVVLLKIKSRKHTK